MMHWEKVLKRGQGKIVGMKERGELIRAALRESLPEMSEKFTLAELKPVFKEKALEYIRSNFSSKEERGPRMNYLNSVYKGQFGGFIGRYLNPKHNIVQIENNRYVWLGEE
jgi:asparagine synthetase A